MELLGWGMSVHRKVSFKEANMCYSERKHVLFQNIATYQKVLFYCLGCSGPETLGRNMLADDSKIRLMVH